MSQHRKEQATLLILLKAAERFRAGTENEADRQLIDLLLTGIAKDKDVRDYFWESVANRPAKHEPLHELAAMLVAVDEARASAAGEQPELKSKNLRYSLVAGVAGLSVGKVRHACETHGHNARAFVSTLAADDLLVWKQIIEARIGALCRNSE